MKVKITYDFVQKLDNQVNFIAKDKPRAARKFKNEILSVIKGLEKHPYKGRKSIYFENEFIREQVFKGYKILYRVNLAQSEIEVFGFLRSQFQP